jgi:hypothetical protein
MIMYYDKEYLPENNIDTLDHSILTASPVLHNFACDYSNYKNP